MKHHVKKHMKHHVNHHMRHHVNHTVKHLDVVVLSTMIWMMVTIRKGTVEETTTCIVTSIMNLDA